MDDLQKEALKRLTTHWGREYDIDVEDGAWKARPKDSKGPVIEAEDDLLLHIALRADYCKKTDARRAAERAARGLRSVQSELAHSQ
jgi:hypothetical protein